MVVNCRTDPFTTALGYNDANQALSESYSGGGVLGGLSVSSTYRGKLQRDSLSLGGVSDYTVNYFYDAAGRLRNVSQGGSVVSYGYVDQSMLVHQITYVHSGTMRLTTTKEPDVLNRLQSINSVAAGGTLSHAYVYNGANQRTRATLADGSYWVYGYERVGPTIDNPACCARVGLGCFQRRS